MYLLDSQEKLNKLFEFKLLNLATQCGNENHSSPRNFINIEQFNIIENNLINCLGTRGEELDGKKNGVFDRKHEYIC